MYKKILLDKPAPAPLRAPRPSLPQRPSLSRISRHEEPPPRACSASSPERRLGRARPPQRSPGGEQHQLRAFEQKRSEVVLSGFHRRRGRRPGPRHTSGLVGPGSTGREGGAGGRCRRGRRGLCQPRLRRPQERGQLWERAPRGLGPEPPMPPRRRGSKGRAPWPLAAWGHGLRLCRLLR